MRLRFPRSMRGQLILVLLGALAIVQPVTISLFSAEREKAITASIAKDGASRVLSIAEVLDETDPENWGNILRAADSHEFVLAIGDRSLAKAADKVEIPYVQIDVLPVLRAPPDRSLSVALRKPDMGSHPSSQTDFDRSWADDPKEIVASAMLSDGKWLNAHIDMGGPPLQWAWPALLSWFLTVAAVVGVAWILVRRIAAPMHSLAASAQRLGRDDTLSRLPSSGPSEVRSLTDSFNDMADRIIRLLTERSRTLAAIGHDLRSPITAMRLRIEFVDDQETRQRLEMCLDEIQSLVDAALELSRGAQSGELRQPTDLAEMLNTVVLEIQEMGGEAIVIRGSDKEVIVPAQKAALKRAVRNVVENATRYGESARLSLIDDDKAASMIVDDDGPGIPAGDRERVFEPFIRLETSRSRETGGSGLGLAIAKNIIVAHGGQIAIEPSESGGARVRMTLPKS